MVLVNEERVKILIVLLIDGPAALDVDRRVKFLLEIDPDSFFNGFETATARLRLFQAQVGAHQNPGLCSKELYVPRNRLRVTTVTDEVIVDPMPSRSADTLLNEAGNVEEHGEFKNRLRERRGQRADLLSSFR
jgi:hypothetical protein